MGRDWGHLFPVLPHQSEANRRTRWLWGAFEQLRAAMAARLPRDDCLQVDTSALPVKHPSRVRHGAHTFWGLLTRTAATIAAHTLLLVCLTHD